MQEKRRIIEAVAVERLSQFILVGGLPRSGTSALDRMLNSSSNCLMSDEFPAVLDPTFRSTLESLANLYNEESRVYLSPDSTTWRGMKEGEYGAALRSSFLRMLMEFSDPQKFSGKLAGDIQMVGLKVPGSEGALGFVRQILSPISVKFVYCARDPLKVLRSNWEMPWWSNAEMGAFLRCMLSGYERSLNEIKMIMTRGWPMVIFRSDRDQLTEVCKFVGIAGANSLDHFDHWCRPKRRPVGTLAPEIELEFVKNRAIIEFRELIGV